MMASKTSPNRPKPEKPSDSDLQLFQKKVNNELISAGHGIQIVI